MYNNIYRLKKQGVRKLISDLINR